MPFVTIKVTGKPVTREQKLALVRDTGEMLHRVLNKPPEITWVVIEEIPPENWGVDGGLAADVLEY